MQRFDEADVAWNPDVFDRADELKVSMRPGQHELTLTL